METTVLAKIKTSFAIEVNKAKSLFEPVFKTINYSTVLPILEDILVERKGGEISFTTTDLESVMTVSMPDEGEDFTCIFPGIELKYLIKNAIKNDLLISLSGEARKPDIIVRNGDFKLKLDSDIVENYPKFVKIDDSINFMIDVKELIPYLETALKFVSNDNLRPSMTGICFIDWKGFLHIAATDAHRLYWHPVCKTPAGFKGCSFILPQKSVRLMISAFRTEKDFILTKDGDHFQAMCEGKQLTTRLLDARYPDFTQIIPEKNPLTFYLKRSELIQNLRLCSPFTNKPTRQLVIDLSPSKFDISGGDVDFSMDFSCSLPVISPSLDTFNTLRFGIDAKFLLQAIEGSKEENVKISSPLSSTKAIVVDDCVLIMPLMLNA